MKNSAGEMKSAETGLLGLYIYIHGKRQQHQLHKQQQKHSQHLAPQIGFSSSGIPKKVELFGDYVARQIGLSKGSAVAKRLADAAMAYLSGDKSSSDHSMDEILHFLSKVASHSLDDDEMVKLSSELVTELDVCMISYFAFHWHYAPHLLDQVRNGERKLKSILWAATRKHRFQKIMTTFKTKRAFSTLLETLKAMNLSKDARVPREGDVVVPADSSVRSPVLLLIGGGMGAGKSTVVKEIMSSCFWSSVVHDAVVVEADAFKETDVIYRTISSSSHGDGGDIALASELVHSASTLAASSLLVSALNEGRDVIFDGTMMWEPFVRQTIEMARDVHNRRYRLGRGYVKSEDGSEIEEYWLPVDEDEEDSDARVQQQAKKPYRIELVGVICDPLLAVIRGIRRAIITKRAVPIKGQLRSHRLFAASLEKYCQLVDHAQVFSTSKMGEPAELIGWKDGVNNRSKLLVDPQAFQLVKELGKVNENAGSVFELYEDSHECDVWKDVVLGPERVARQAYLKEMLGSSDVDLDLSTSDSSVSHHSSAGA